MSRFLIVTWDGAGNLVPTLGLARRLAQAGHDVRVLGHRSIHRRCGAHEWRFRPLRHAADYDSTVPHELENEMSTMAQRLWLNRSVASDVRDEIIQEPADVLIGDCMLMAALCAGQAAGLPTVALFHGAFALFRRGPLADMLNSSLPALNALRADLGLPAAARISDVHDRCAISLVATPREFEPEMPVPPNVRFVGPILGGPPLMNRTDDVDLPPRSAPLVVVSFSTSDQGHVPLLRRMVEALGSVPVQVIVTTGPAVDPASMPAAANVRVVRFVPHDRLLPHASLVITHGGLGTIMTALACGIPMLCVPLGRDQFFNASRVEALGAGRIIGRDADGNTIAGVVRMLLDDDATRVSAGRLSDVIAGYKNGSRAITELEQLAKEERPLK